jgi:hypothetical protein
MKRILWIFCVSFAPVFAMDEYLAIPQGKFEVKGGMVHERITGIYDDDGERHTWDEIGFDFSPAQSTLNVQFKAGLVEGLDFEAAWSASQTNEDAGDLSGFGQPELGLKYAPASLGAGAFVNVTLPFATGDFDSPNLETALEAGVLIRKQVDVFRFTGVASYLTNLDFDEGAIELMAKPEFLIENAGIFLKLTGLFDRDGDGYRVNLAPGVNARIQPGTDVEFFADFTVAGKNTVAGWGFGAEIRQLFPL